MATKGTKNFLDKLFGKETSPQEEMRKEQVQLAQSRERAKNMINKLRAIDFNDPNNQLSTAYIQEKRYDEIVKFAINELNQNVVIPQNTEKLDIYIDQAVNCLIHAIKEGLPTAAEWACVALHSAVTTLRIEVPAIDQEFEDALMESKLNYAKNLEIMFCTSMEYDIAQKHVDKQSERYKEAQEATQAKKAAYVELRDTPDGIRAEEDLRVNLSTGNLSPEAQHIREMLYELHRAKARELMILADINTKKVEVMDKENTIDMTRNRLAEAPHVTDPKMQEKIKQANEVYLENLLRQLNNANENLRAFDQFISKLQNLQDHEVFIRINTAALNESDALKLEEQERLRRDQEMLSRMQHRQQEMEYLKLEQQRVEEELQTQYNLQMEQQEEAEQEEEYLVNEIYVAE